MIKGPLNFFPYFMPSYFATCLHQPLHMFSFPESQLSIKYHFFSNSQAFNSCKIHFFFLTVHDDEEYLADCRRSFYSGQKKQKNLVTKWNKKSFFISNLHEYPFFIWGRNDTKPPLHLEKNFGSLNHKHIFSSRCVGLKNLTRVAVEHENSKIAKCSSSKHAQFAPCRFVVKSF